MGGRALKQTFTRRYGRDEYNDLVLSVAPALLCLFQNPRALCSHRVHVVRSYSAKRDFGDMDILLENDGSLGNVSDKINAHFKPQQIVSNGGVYSFDHRELQIDVILVNSENWDVAVAFYDFDPSGNLIGKVAHKFGLKYGFTGLVYPYRGSDGVQRADIPVSKDNREIFEFLGFDYGRYASGFETLSDIFDYVTNSKYFDPQNFMMENLNSIDRKRNKHRQTYHEFLTHINAQAESGRKWNQTFHDNKEKYLPLINQSFPSARIYAKIEECAADDAKRRLAASKFNAVVIVEMYPELSREALGEFIKGFRSHIVEVMRLGRDTDGTDSDIFREYVIDSSPAVIRGDIEGYYYSLRKQK
jgi:hypothetical protein